MVRSRTIDTDVGQATVEFALILPFFLLLIVTLFDITAIVRDQLHVDALARDAARRASQASDVREAHTNVADSISRAGRSDARWRLVLNDDMATVRISLRPHGSFVANSLQWFGGPFRVEGSASFVTEYDIDDQ
ncbi:MAG: TadE/TadG family type IV pilus assembly protein [Ilumatobacteraceae bacterium]